MAEVDGNSVLVDGQHRLRSGAKGSFSKEKFLRRETAEVPKNDELSLSFSLEKSDFRARRIGKEISRLKGVTPEMHKRIHQCLEPSGEG